MRLCRYPLPLALLPFASRLMIILILNEVMSCHFCWLLYAEDVAEGWCYVREDTIFELRIGVLFAYIHEWHRVQRVRGVR